MSVSIVFTFIGNDKPGLVRQLSETVSQHGGNWLESRMSQLAGQFAGIARVQIASGQAEQLVGALHALSGKDLNITVHDEEDSATTTTIRPVHLSLIGNDRPGIVHELSKALADSGINVCEMNTNVTSAPMTGEPLFSAQAEIQVPETIDRLALNDMLDDIANELAVDIALDSE